MPHGDFSDASALFFAVTGAATVFAPQLYFAKASFLEVHPMLEIHPMLETEATPELLNVIQFAGGLLMLFAPVLFVVRWNKLNGKAAALGLFTAAGNTASFVLRKDDFKFVLRGWYLFVAMFVLAGMHLAFNANPMLTSAMLLEKEGKAKGGAGKAKGGKSK